MKKNLFALAFLLALAGAAHAFGIGLGNRFGRMGAMNKAGSVTPPPVSTVLLVNTGVALLVNTGNKLLVQ